MARSFSSAKIVTALVSNAISRRGYSAAASSSASQGVVSGAARGGAAAASRSVSKDQAAEKVSWVPDPVTGYYRPEGVAEEIDVAELRAMLLKKN